MNEKEFNELRDEANDKSNFYCKLNNCNSINYSYEDGEEVCKFYNKIYEYAFELCYGIHLESGFMFRDCYIKESNFIPVLLYKVDRNWNKLIGYINLCNISYEDFINFIRR